MNNDLISRREALESISKIDEGVVKCAGDMKVLALIHIKELPVAYDMDKVVEQLEQQEVQYTRRSEEIKNKFGESQESRRLFSKACSYNHAIEIAKAAASDRR